ncbi:efflux RND transporter permease subunit [bacterium]|nr:efflux RND transporter permease subunit [bacterium]
MFLSDLSIKRPVMISMVLLVFVLFGGLAYIGLNLELMPEIKLPMVTVQTIYPGASPKEIETQITKKLEDAVSPIAKIDKVNSFSMESVSFVFISFDLDKDVYTALQEVKDKVDGVLNSMPDDAERPLVQRFDITEESVVDIVLSGNQSVTELYELADKVLSDRLAQIDGVANVTLSGGQEREIHIELNNRTVFQNKISIAQLAGILKAQNMNMPGGHFQRRSQEFSVRLDGEFEDINSIKKLQIPTAYGLKNLGDIANITDTGAEVRERTSFFNNVTDDRKDGVIVLSLMKTSDGNAVHIARELAKALPEISASLPQGVTLEVVRDNSTFIEATVKDTLSNILMGILLTAGVLLFFLHDYKSTLIAGLSMPLSILGTFFFIKLSGYTLNIMTLMGLSTAVGVLVTNSVVVLENIFRHKEMGHSNREAASKGTSEIVVAVIASGMTNIAVFLPIANMSSIIGQFFEQFAMTVVFATIFSLVMSFTLTPMMASRILPEHDKKKHPIGTKLEAMFRMWEKTYKRWLTLILKTKLRGVGVILAALILLGLSFIPALQVGFDFIPKTDEGDIKLQVELPVGYRLEETAILVSTIESRIREHAEVKHMLTSLGKFDETTKGTELAFMQIKLVDASNRTLSTDEMVSRIIKDCSDIPNAMIRVSATSNSGGGQDPIELSILGQDMDVLEDVQHLIMDRISDVPGLINLNTTFRSGKPELTIKPDRDKLAKAGLTMADVAFALRGAMEGLVNTRYRDQGEEYDIRVAMTDETVDSPDKVGLIPVVGFDETYQIRQLGQVVFTKGTSRILHKNKMKEIKFTGGVAPGHVLGNIQTAIDARIAEIDLPQDVTIEWGGNVEMMQDANRDMGQTFLLAILLTYMLLAAILESLTQPLLILGTVPLALIGVFVGLFATGLSMNIISMMAIIMLVGIVVNNAILMLDYTNSLVRDKGYKISDALIEACPTKLKPILMSSIAIMLSMMPMAMGMGAAGREIRQPMGVVAIGGLVTSTILTLFVIPALVTVTTRTRKVKNTK